MRPLPDQPQLIYLEPDDEITSVVRRLRAAEGSSVVIVAPGRSRATSSAVALRLLAQVAAEEARTLALVADASTRAVAGEAGIAAFASVAEATSGSAAPEHAGTPRAPIHVVRGLAEGLVAAAAPLAVPGARGGSADETMAVRVAPSPSTGSRGGARRRSLLPRWPWLAGLLTMAVIAGAALVPGATVTITPATQTVGPKAYQLQLPVAGHKSSNLNVTRPGTATGQRMEQTPATGTVIFFNRSKGQVPIPKGTSVSVAGTIAFTTVEKIVVPGALEPGSSAQKSVGVVAVVGGPGGNVAAGAIDTIADPAIRFDLQVTNSAATAGGIDTPHAVIQQSDVDAVEAAIRVDLASHLADALAGQPDRVYAGAPATEVSQINVPPGLVGKEDTPTFELTGMLAFDRQYVMRTDVEAAARAKLLDDSTAAPLGTSVLPDSIAIQIGTATANGAQMTIAVSLRAAAAAAIDKAAVRDLVAGKTVAETMAVLADRGKVLVALWPGWLDRLPRIPFRISVEAVAPSPAATASP